MTFVPGEKRCPCTFSSRAHNKRLSLGQFVMRLFNAVLGAGLFFIPSSIGWPAVHPGETSLTVAPKPIPCHSHNDYYRSVPLFSAIEAGCIGVEADIWLFGDDLYVGHTPHSLSKDRTLKNMYLDPLLDLLSKQNQIADFDPVPNDSPKGVFDADPSQALVLLIDFKAKGRKIWPHLTSQLSALRDSGYLTHFNGTNVVERPITVVATGKAPLDLVTADSSYRYVFFDAPLDKLSRSGRSPHAGVSTRSDLSDDDDIESAMYAFIEENRIESHQPLDSREDIDSLLDRRGKVSPGSFDSTNSYYASVSYRTSVGIPWGFRVSKKQLKTIREQVRAAHHHGLKVRYWATPGWPRRLRDHVWTVLLQEGADILNVDDLRSATRKGNIWRLAWSRIPR